MTGKEKFEFNKEDAFYDIFSDNIVKNDFDFCCGATIIGNFPEDTETSLILELQEAFNNQWVDYCYDFCRRPKKPRYPDFKSMIGDEIKYRIETNISLKSGHLYFVILNEVQKWMSKYLKEKGFRLVSDRTVNKNSSQRLYVYLYDSVTPKGKTTKKRLFH